MSDFIYAIAKRHPISEYEEKVPYVPIRLFCATFGVLTIPIAYLTIRAAGFSKLAGVMTAIIVCFGRAELSFSGQITCPHINTLPLTD